MAAIPIFRTASLYLVVSGTSGDNWNDAFKRHHGKGVKYKKILCNVNLKLFFRDRARSFFSLMAVLIIIALFAVFLGDVWLPGFHAGASIAQIT